MRARPGYQLALDPLRVGLLEQQRLVQGSLLLDDLREGGLVAAAVVDVVDLVVVAGEPAQPHDLVHRRDVLGAGVHAREAVGAVVDAVRVLRQVVEPLPGLRVARVAHEAIRLGKRRRADEPGIGLQRQAGRDAGAALDAGHHLGDVDHRLGRHHVLALGRLALGQQPGRDAADLRPVRGLHVRDQVLDHRHVRHRLHHDRVLGFGPVAPVGALVGLADPGLAAERRLPVDLHPARAADRRPARAADDERPVGAVADLEQPVEHREVGIEVDLELLPVRAPARLRLVPPNLQRVLSRPPISTSSRPAATG